MLKKKKIFFIFVKLISKSNPKENRISKTYVAFKFTNKMKNSLKKNYCSVCDLPKLHRIQKQTKKKLEKKNRTKIENLLQINMYMF